jgi:hypothetical protein
MTVSGKKKKDQPELILFFAVDAAPAMPAPLERFSHS